MKKKGKLAERQGRKGIGAKDCNNGIYTSRLLPTLH